MNHQIHHASSGCRSTYGWGLAVLLLSGCAGADKPLPVALTPPDACVTAGDQCVASIGDVAACRAAQATCQAVDRQFRERNASVGDPKPVVASSPKWENPPMSPDGENPDEGKDPALVASCEDFAREIVEARLHGHIQRRLVTQGKTSGVAWRADFELPPETGEYPQRIVCSRAGVWITPLKMQDGSPELRRLPQP